MRRDRLNYVLVGSFVLAAIAALIVAIALLTGRTGATSPYFALFDDVTGVKFGTQVLYQGYAVGQVQAVEPVEGEKRFRVELSVRRGFAIDRDARARIGQSGFLSAMVINIRGGGAEALLEPGGEIASEESPDVLAALSKAAGQVAELLDTSVRPLLDDAGRTVPEVLAHANAFAEQLETSSRRLNDILAEENIASVRNAVRNAEAVSADLAALTAELGETRKRLDGAMSAVQRLVESNQGGVEQGVRDLQYSLEAIARRIDGVTQHLEGTSRNLNEFSREIRDNPSVLLRGTTPPEDGGAKVSN